MTDREFWFWLWVAVLASITLCCLFSALRSIFYYKHESKRQIEVAKAGFEPHANTEDKY